MIEKNEMVESTPTNEIVVENRNNARFTNKLETIEEQKAFFNALNGGEMILLKDIVNQTIKVKDVYFSDSIKKDEDGNIEINEKTGEPKLKHRTILFDVDGNVYATGSYGVYFTLGKIFQAFGTPTWEKGFDLKVVSVKQGKGQMLNLEVV